MERTNNFDAIRLLAAGLVVYGHAFPLNGAEAPGICGNSIQTVGVKIFFIISGFLISQSWLRDPHVARFATRRALRILPGLFLVVSLTILVLGPLRTSLPLRDYFTNTNTWRYLENLALHISFSLPGVFDTNTYPRAVNGSLWSLPAEVVMYVLLPLLMAVSGRRRAPVVVAALALLGASLYFARFHKLEPAPVIYNMSLVSFIDVAPYFLAGTLFALFDLRRLLDPQLAVVLMIVAVTLRASMVTMELYLYLALPCVTLALGLATPARLAILGRYGDFSYGVYLYGFPIQQTVSSLWGPIAPNLNFLISLPLVYALAALSWHLVEKRALLLKPRRAPGQPVAGVEVAT